MIYGYRCRECGVKRDSTSREDIQPCSCGGISRRDYRTTQLQPSAALKPHFNFATGTYVNNDREFRDALKRSSEENSIRTGLDHNFEPRYPGDTSTPYPEAIK